MYFKSNSDFTVRDMILSHLDGGFPQVPDRLARMCSIAPRTLRKHINALRSEGYPICTTYPDRCYKMTRDLSEMGSTIALFKHRALGAHRQERALVKKALPKLAGQITANM